MHFRRPFRSLAIRTVLPGLAAGLGFFALEAVLILRGESAGVRVDLKGPFAAVFAAVQPLLPGLFARIATVYAVSGVVLVAAARVLAGAWSTRTRWARVAVVTGEATAILALWMAWKAVHRPALFDDLPALLPALRWLVDSVMPWQVAVAALAWCALHLVVALRSSVVGSSPAAAPRRAMAGWLTGAAVVLAVALAFSSAPPRTTHSEPLLVVIGVDAFRPDRLQTLGGRREVAPALDAFVAHASLFERAYTPIAQTEPAWRSLLTARWPHRTGVRYPLTPDAHVVPLETFPGHLAASGFDTAFATDCSRFHYEGEASGFASRSQPPRGAINFVLEKLRFRAVGLAADNALGAWWLPEMVDNRALAGIHDPYGYAERLGDAWVERASRGSALLTFHATAAHFPGDPVYPHYRQFVSPGEPLSRRLRMVYAPIGSETSAWTREGTEALYDELLAQADAQVGILLERLRRAGLYDRATIVVFSDHGESFHSDHPEFSGAMPVHGARLQEEENRILLAVKLPGQRAATRIDSLVRLIDLGPTLLELAGAAPLKSADGQSLWPLLAGEVAAPRMLYAETGFTHAVPSVFDADHLVGAQRVFEAYEIRPDGVVEMSTEAAAGTLREKDIGAFDGAHWLIRSPRRDGGISERCTGNCEPLRAFLDGVDPARVARRLPGPGAAHLAQ